MINMTLLGYKSNTDPEFQKKCLLLWLEKGSAQKAGFVLGVSATTVSHHSWRYLLTHLEEAREYLNSDASVDSRYGRSLNDQEFAMVMTKKAIQFLPPRTFDKWMIAAGYYKDPKVRQIYARRYPTYHKKHEELANSESVPK
jgi:hypothetical protein